MEVDLFTRTVIVGATGTAVCLLRVSLLRRFYVLSQIFPSISLWSCYNSVFFSMVASRGGLQHNIAHNI